jgi:uncharacterized protein YjbI with pentapeptide repeats
VAAVAVPAVLLLAGAVVAVIAVARASAAVLVPAALLLLAGVAPTALVAQRRLTRPGRRALAIGGAVALAAAVLIPASLNVDPCTRLGPDADLSGCDLSGQDLSGEDLAGADLSGANLRETDLSRARLVEADLTGAVLRDADLSDARLFDAVLPDVDLRGVQLTSAALSGVDLTGADLSDASATTADLTDAVLAGTDLSGSDLSEAALLGADLTDADLSGAALAAADLTDADLQRADLTGADAGEALFVDAGLVEADLTEAVLTSAAAPGADLQDAVLAGTELGANDLRGVENLTNEALTSALDVPGEALAGATARRGIVFDDLREIVDALGPVADGEGVAGAQAYAPSDRFHPAVVLDGQGGTGWLDDVEDAWAPTGLRFAQLVIVVEPEENEAVQQCTDYYFTDDGTRAPNVVRYVRSVTVRVLAAQDARVVDERTFRGTDPRYCQEQEQFVLGNAAIYGDHPDLDAEAQPWLAGLVNAPDERAEIPPPTDRQDGGASDDRDDEDGGESPEGGDPGPIEA